MEGLVISGLGASENHQGGGEGGMENAVLRPISKVSDFIGLEWSSDTHIFLNSWTDSNVQSELICIRMYKKITSLSYLKHFVEDRS